MTAKDQSPGSGWTQSWLDAPAPVIDVDAAGMVAAANKAFAELTGYDPAEIVGALPWLELLTPGSRLFFQTQLDPILLLSGSLTEVMADIRSRTGEVRPVLLNARRVFDTGDRCVGLRVAFTTVSERRQYEAALLDARKQAEQAHEATGRTQRRLILQTNATSALASSRDPGTALRRLAGVLVPSLADWCLIFTSDPAEMGNAMVCAGLHADPGLQSAVDRVAELLPANAGPSTFFAQSLQGSPTTLVATVDDAHLDEATTDPELRELLGRLDIGSAIVAPSYARGERVAVTILIRGRGRPAFSTEDRDDIAEVAARTGIVIDNTRRYAREHADSVTLQTSLLTRPPLVGGLEIAVRYLPAHDEAQVGGDWYDAYVQPDGATAVAIGDVVGHNIAAAAAMGQLRGILRTIGYTIAGTPSNTLARADRTAQGLGTQVIASAVLATITRTADGHALCWSNAGHPPPLLVRPGGTVEVLEREADIMLGVAPDLPRHDHVVDFPPGSTLLLYTDGLIEHADEGIDRGLERLAAALRTAGVKGVQSVCDHLLATVGSSRLDDIAMLAVRAT
jgi:PAS domain S-box-containing protein